jgi:hypothetical protein
MEDVHIIDTQRTKKRQKYTLWCMYITLLLDQIYHCVNEVQLLFFWIITNFPYSYMYLLHCIALKGFYQGVAKEWIVINWLQMLSDICTLWFKGWKSDCDFLIQSMEEIMDHSVQSFFVVGPNELFNKATVWILLFPFYYYGAPQFFHFTFPLFR